MTDRKSAAKNQEATLYEGIGSQQPLPFWPEHLRGVPTAALYSALFAPVRRGARSAVQRERIAAVGEYQITYTGFRLDQGDLDVFEQCVHLSRGEKIGKPVKIRTRELLKAVGRSNGKPNREWLLRSLSRLQACAVEVKKGTFSYSGSLIAELGRNDADLTHYIILNPRLVALFDQGYSQISWAQRMALARRPIAQWLHGFISNQTHPLSFRMEDLMRYAATGYTRERDFRAALEDAAKDIRGAGLALVILWSSDNQVATFTRSEWKNSATAVPQGGV